jgi:hypothetical protein
MKLNCSSVSKLDEAYVDGTLPTQVRAAIEAHVIGCARCERRLTLARQIAEGMADGVSFTLGSPLLSPTRAATLQERIRMQLDIPVFSRLRAPLIVAAIVTLVLLVPAAIWGDQLVTFNPFAVDNVEQLPGLSVPTAASANKSVLDLTPGAAARPTQAPASTSLPEHHDTSAIEDTHSPWSRTPQHTPVHPVASDHNPSPHHTAVHHTPVHHTPTAHHTSITKPSHTPVGHPTAHHTATPHHTPGTPVTHVPKHSPTAYHTPVHKTATPHVTKTAHSTPAHATVTPHSTPAHATVTPHSTHPPTHVPTHGPTHLPTHTATRVPTHVVTATPTHQAHTPTAQPTAHHTSTAEATPTQPHHTPTPYHTPVHEPTNTPIGHLGLPRFS